jgi:hypothetical protein
MFPHGNRWHGAAYVAAVGIPILLELVAAGTGPLFERSLFLVVTSVMIAGLLGGPGPGLCPLDARTR